MIMLGAMIDSDDNTVCLHLGPVALSEIDDAIDLFGQPEFRDLIREQIKTAVRQSKAQQN